MIRMKTHIAMRSNGPQKQVHLGCKAKVQNVRFQSMLF